MANFRSPNVNAPDVAGQMRQIVSYLRQLAEELNFRFSMIEKNTEKKVEEKKETPTIQWPVGSVYRTVRDNDPRRVFGGRWERRDDDGDEHVWVRTS